MQADSLKNPKGQDKWIISKKDFNEYAEELSSRFASVPVVPEVEWPFKICEGCGQACTSKELEANNKISCCPYGKHSEHEHNQFVRECIAVHDKAVKEGRPFIKTSPKVCRTEKNNLRLLQTQTPPVVTP